MPAMSEPGERFAFGENWASFLACLDDERIAESERCLCKMLEVEDLRGLSFLDIGSGSGLSSLAARRLGARVRSFDFDPRSVACTEELRRRYFPDDPEWTVEQASALDEAYLRSLGAFDLIYAWGVLHHTGGMWRAIELASRLVRPGGKFHLAIYNDQGGVSRRWRTLKRFYNRAPRPVRWALVLAVGVWWELRAALARLARFENPLPFRDWAAKKKSRGMSVWHDLVDWVGGYPFEFARPEEVFDFLRARGFTLVRLRTTLGHGTNEFVFRRPN
ncbi:MAG: class I SAM-dependent methyltransferase [Planctomycetes bacterium]|nr:class I SAM-dependent methyltransferase [Planctomycetota bacterium]